MSFTPEQLDKIAGANHRLVIFGKFSEEENENTGDDSFVFSNSGDKDGKVTVHDFFHLVKPQLNRISEGEEASVEIGRHIFNSPSLKTPNETKSTSKSQPQYILSDSALFEDDSFVLGDQSQDTAEIIQQKGGRLFEQLLKDLDVVVHFYHGNFAKALIRLARIYLYNKAKKISSNTISLFQWEQLISTNHKLASTLVKYLTCYEDDSSHILSEFRRDLNEVKESNDELGLDAARIEALSVSLQELREYLSHGPTTLSKDFNPVLFDMTRDSNLGWLNDFESSPEYRIKGPQLTDEVLKKEVSRTGRTPFIAYYREFRNASDNVSRFIRTSSLHSYLFCWLASKYKKHSMTTKLDVAQEMFAVGIRDQKRRIVAEDKEELKKSRKLIRKTVEDRQRNVDLEDHKSIEAFIELNIEDLISRINPTKSFSKKNLQNHLMYNFAVMSQLAGGVGGQLFEQNKEFNEKYIKFFHRILVVQAADDEKGLSVNDFSIELKKIARDGEEEFVDEFLSKVKPGKGDLRQAIKEEFLIAYAIKSDENFERLYGPKLDRIKLEEESAKKVYMLNQLDVAAEDSFLGLPIKVTDVSVKLPGESEDVERKRKKELLEYANEMGAKLAKSRPRIESPIPSKLKEPLGEIGKVFIKDKDEVVAEVAVQENELEVTPVSAEAIIDLDLDKASVENANGDAFEFDGKAIKVADLDILGIEEWAEEQKLKTEELEKSVDEYETLTSTFNRLIDSYTSEDGDISSEFIQKRFRALVLGEYMLAAPKNTVHFGAHDLSQLYGLLVDMVENIGDMNEGGPLYKNAPSDGASSKLNGINLSKYYPVSDKSGQEQIANILEFHYQLCEDLENVKTYLDELQELKRFIDNAPADIDISIVNNTLEDHLENDFQQLAFASEQIPSVIYLTKQAFRDRDPVAAINKITDVILDPGLNDGQDIILPIVVTPSPVKQNEVSLPVISPEQLDLPELVEGKPGTSEESDKTVVDKLIQRKPYLLLASVMLSRDGAFGRIGTDRRRRINKEDRSDVFWSIPNNERRKWKEKLSISIENGASVGALLRMSCFNLSSNGKNNVLLENILMSKYVNLGFMIARTPNDAQGHNDIQGFDAQKFKASFPKFLAAALGDRLFVDAMIVGMDEVKKFFRLQSVSVRQSGTRDFQPLSGLAQPLPFEVDVQLRDENGNKVLEILSLPWCKNLAKRFK